MNTLDLFFCVVLQAAARVADPDLAYRYLTPQQKQAKGVYKKTLRTGNQSNQLIQHSAPLPFAILCFREQVLK